VCTFLQHYKKMYSLVSQILFIYS